MIHESGLRSHAYCDIKSTSTHLSNKTWSLEILSLFEWTAKFSCTLRLFNCCLEMTWTYYFNAVQLIINLNTFKNNFNLFKHTGNFIRGIITFLPFGRVEKSWKNQKSWFFWKKWTYFSLNSNGGLINYFWAIFKVHL